MNRRQMVSPKLLTIYLLIGLIAINQNGCEGVPLPASVVLPTDEIPSLVNDHKHMALKRVSEPNRIGNLTRNHGGDIFYVFGMNKTY